MPSAVPPSFGVCRTRRDRRRRGFRPVAIGAARYRWSSAPEPTGGDGRSCVPRSVRRLPGPFTAVVAPVSTSHRVSMPTCDGYSSRSQPRIRLSRARMVAGTTTGVKADGRDVEIPRRRSARGRPDWLAERVGFEPTKSCDSALFKSAAFNRSATSPGEQDSALPRGPAITARRHRSISSDVRDRPPHRAGRHRRTDPRRTPRWSP